MVELALRVVVSLGVVLGLFWAVARTGARRSGGRDRALVRVRSRQALSRGSSLAVVEVGSRVLVVGVSDSGVRLLTELEPDDVDTTATPVDRDDDEDGEVEVPRFADLLDAEVHAAVDASAAPALVSVAVPAAGRHRAAVEPVTAPVTAGARKAGRPTRSPKPKGARAARPTADTTTSGGSILAPATWKQAWAAATGRASDGTAA